MQAEIICIGTELLLGEIVDTNAAFIAGRLADLGVDLYYKTTVGDNLERIIGELMTGLGKVAGHHHLGRVGADAGRPDTRGDRRPARRGTGRRSR